MSNNCDNVFIASQIIPNVVNGMQGSECRGLKVEKGFLKDFLDKSIEEGLVLIFDIKSHKVIDILYKKDVKKFLNDFSNIVIEDIPCTIIHSIENLEEQEYALKMIHNFLNIILDNCK